ncbi:hypothetical protein MNBD_GAMMA24-625 [hydrothermal vent metagenome]|uniref:Uncharacterized protein n=1 Tax=hydrothermal vent metagenome TaxID=652676 RepID=A0A3B1C6M3_9ZZZZ
MKPFPNSQIPDDLPPKTALALIDLLNGLVNTIWLQYHHELIQCIHEEHNIPPSSQMALRLDDSIEF